ncbi:MAG: DUF3617 family protein [Phenylobacterium sp.]|nr:DUF3617 family protein [Phenylobacterium sp.]
MRKSSLTLIALISLAACGAKPADPAAAPAAAPAVTPVAGLKLGADNLPRFRAGLWESVQNEGGESETQRRCIGAEVDAEMRQLLTRETPSCQTRRSASSSGLKIEAVCDQAGGLKTETRLTMTGSETAYDMILGLYVVQPDGTRDGGETTVRARWIGACPAGVSPGEDVEG